ncbi:hypothetical protein DLJ49_00045 [Rhodovulum sp. 12E13]|uniref:hypothetical protein n=1 Tax=Rhodovulum sp. 12E13 TaxID=2203891 RepID=UPI000E16E1AB|nr:hypothetical protein [Rhodovulum sp. 12E13]RDC75187.1 hypothetical protein DLJ49_00045 [Rhodovulum sp. 12E13]
MQQTLDDLLAGDDPAELGRAEAALAGCDGRDSDLDAALTALIWRRRAQGPRGIVETLIRPDCVERLDRIATDLERVGARDAATAFRRLRRACPLADAQLGPGVIDWLDTEFDFARTARRIETDLDDIAPDVWAFLRRRRSACAGVPLPPERRGLLARLFG